MKTTRTNNYGYNANTLVSFKIGRGGRFNNAGHVSFIDSDKDLFNNLDGIISERTEDKDGNPCAAYLIGGSSETVLMNANEYADAMASGEGRLDFDGDYCTYYTITIGECDDTEAAAIIAKNPYNCDSLIAAMVEAGAIDEDYLTIETDDEDDE